MPLLDKGSGKYLDRIIHEGLSQPRIRACSRRFMNNVGEATPLIYV